jgi:AcrR family transcriptional regulator
MKSSRGTPKTRRPYVQRKRAERAAETRERIARAAAELHEAVGPAATTISAVADRAGVQRVTVYRHFPDEAALFRACQSHYLSEHPPPEATWLSLADPDARLRAALASLYEYYQETAEMTEKLMRDAAKVPVLAEILAPYASFLAFLIEALLEGRHKTKELRATIAHALAFETWADLVRRNELSNRAAVDLMVKLVAAAAETETTK